MSIALSASAEKDAGIYVEIIAAGALSPLVALLDAGSTSAVRDVGAGDILFLFFNADNIIKIATAGAIPPPHGIVGRSERGSGAEGGSNGSEKHRRQCRKHTKDRRCRCHPPPGVAFERSQLRRGTSGGGRGAVQPGD